MSPCAVQLPLETCRSIVVVASEASKTRTVHWRVSDIRLYSDRMLVRGFSHERNMLPEGRSGSDPVILWECQVNLEDFTRRGSCNLNFADRICIVFMAPSRMGVPLRKGC